MKPCFEPLLPPGRHLHSLSRFRQVCVDPFPESARRPLIHNAFLSLHNQVRNWGLCGELWCNGSFLTRKPEPDDVDVVLSAYTEQFYALDPSIFWTLHDLNGKKINGGFVHFYTSFRFRQEDPRAVADRSAYWGETWGKDWEGNLKGYSVIRVGDSDVGLRLCS